MSTNGVEIARIIPPPDIQVVRSDERFMPVMAIARAVERYNAIVEFTKQIMTPGKDYGEIPGTDKPTLLKPGAEKLCNFFGLTPKFHIVEKQEMWDGAEPFFYYWYKCTLWRGDYFMGEGDGSANSRESKYRYRWVGEAQLPPGADKSRFEARDGAAIEMDFAVQKAETTGKYGKPASYWQAFKDAIANGTAERVTKEIKNGEKKPAWKIGAAVYRVPNPDIADQVNTLQKMSQKRSFIAATLIGTNASEYFTQDMEDLEPIESFTPHAPSVSTLPIDTGGHPVNTQAAANHVADRKIAEMKRAQVPAEVKRAVETPVTEQAAQTLDAVQRMWSQMTDIKSTLKVFENLKKNLKSLFGDDPGERFYYAALGKQGVEHANEFKSTRPARLAAQEMLEAIQAAEQPHTVGNDALPDDWPAGTQETQ